jgi:putative transposase
MIWVKRRYPNLSAQSAQQTVSEFLEAVSSAKQLRRNGQPEARYPWRLLRYRDITYTNQDARVYGDFLRLPNGKAGALRIKISIAFPGRIKEVRLSFGHLLVVCEIDDQPCHADGTVVGVDLGVNTLIAATDGEKAVLVNGREVKATVQWRNKRLASLQEKQAGKTKRSRRWKRLQRRKHRLLEKARNKVRDTTHKATRKIADAFPRARVVAGEPFNDAARRIGCRQAQQVSQACNRKILDQLGYKMARAVTVTEHYTSQTCPVCGARRRARRVYECPCGYTAPRDVIGCTNIRRIGLHGRMTASPDVPRTIRFVRPVSKYPGISIPGSSGGTPASSSSSFGRARSLSF